MGAPASHRPVRACWRVCLLVAVAALLPYLRLPSQPIVYDGQLAIQYNEALRTGPLLRLFTVDFWGESTEAAHSTRSWRPLVSLSWALQMRLCGDSAAVDHTVDMLLHAAASALVVLLLAAWGIERRWLWGSGLLFALHPLQTDAVASTVGRADVMAAICLFGALLLSQRVSVWRGAALVLVAAGLLCKEYAVAFPFVLLASDLAQRRRQRWMWAASFSLLGAYLLLRVALFGDVGAAPASPDFHPLAGAPLATRLATSLALIPLALRLTLLPYALNHHYRFGTLAIPEGLLDGRALWGLALVALLVVGAVWCWVRCRDSLPAFALALFLLPLGPSLHVLGVAGVLFAERFLYVPLAALSLAVAWALERWALTARARGRAVIVLSLVLALFAWMTYDRVGDWASMERLARSSLASYPNGSDVWKQLGVALVRDARPAEAIGALERALTINPRDAQAWTVYADALRALQRYEEGSVAIGRAIDLAPAPAGVLLREAGQLRLLAGHAAEAVPPLQQAHELMPADARSLYYLAQAHLLAGSPEAAVRALERGEAAMRTDPDSLRPLLEKARSLLEQKRKKK